MSNCIQVLAELMPGAKEFVTQQIVEEAASRRGVSVMQTLFDTGNGITVSKAMMVGAARNTIYGHAVLLFLAGYDSDFAWFLDDEVIQTAAEYGDLRTIIFLLGNTFEASTAGFSIAAAKNKDLGVIELVFNNRKTTVTAQELETAAANSDSALQCLLQHVPKKHNLQPGTSIGCSIAANCCWIRTLQEAVDSHLVEVDGLEDKVALVNAAVRNCETTEMIRYVLRQYWRLHDQITPCIFVTAAKNPNLAAQMLRILFNKCEANQVSFITTRVSQLLSEDGDESSAARNLFRLFKDELEIAGNEILEE